MSAKRRADGPAVKTKPGRRTPKQKFVRLLKWLTITGLVLALLGVGGFVVLYQAIDIPDANKDFETQTSFVYYDDGKSEVGRFALQNRESISLEEMPQHLQDAVVAAENKTFWTDKGIDPKGMLRAFLNNASGESRQGASTITQQYIKILYLTSESSYKRKVKEAILSLKMQRQLTKSEVLEGYLNTIYFGRGAYGVQAASKAFFAKPAKKLTLRESAVLASLLNNPSRFDPANGKESRRALKGRYSYALNSMADMGTVTSEQAAKASRRLPKFPKIAAESRYGGQRGHMLTLVRNELKALGFTDQEIDGQGLRVTTTFSKQAMAAAEQAVLTQRPEGFGDKQLHIGVASLEVGTGAVKGFYGGQDYLQSQINWAATGGMAGSTMKAYANAAAVKQGFEIRDSFQGTSPYRFPGGLEVNNQGNKSYAPRVSMIQATANSINTAYMDMTDAMDDGPEAIYDMAMRMGIPGPKANSKYPGIPSTSPDLSPDDTLISLGRARVSPINMANGYATLANGGMRAEAHVVQKVVDSTGEAVYTAPKKTKRALDEDIAADISYTLQQVVTNGSGKAALSLNRPAAGKTGTATNSKDEVSSSWFVGYTPQLATAVMYVRGDGDDGLDGWLPEYFGGSYPARTWTADMLAATEGMEVEDFPDPVYVEGEAPSDGHEYVPPPPKPTKTKTKDKDKDKNEPGDPVTTTPPTTQAPTTAPTTEEPTTDPPTFDPPTTDPTTDPPITLGPDQRPMPGWAVWAPLSLLTARWDGALG